VVGSVLVLAAQMAAADAMGQVKTAPPTPAAPGAAASPKSAVPAETADCARMPTETQKSDCLKQHPYTGHTLLPD
jgi:hypothetical protein